MELSMTKLTIYITKLRYHLHQQHPVIGSGGLEIQATALGPVLLLTRSGGDAIVVVAINSSAAQEIVTSSTGEADTTFDCGLRCERPVRKRRNRRRTTGPEDSGIL